MEKIVVFVKSPFVLENKINCKEAIFCHVLWMKIIIKEIVGVFSSTEFP